jgi:hypothetical protein
MSEYAGAARFFVPLFDGRQELKSLRELVAADPFIRVSPQSSGVKRGDIFASENKTYRKQKAADASHITPIRPPVALG